MKFRKKPIEVEAAQWLPDPTMARFSNDGRYENIRIGYDAQYVEYTVCDVGLRTAEGFMHLTPGYWIVTGIKGERYAVRPDIFEATYEPVQP